MKRGSVILMTKVVVCVGVLALTVAAPTGYANTLSKGATVSPAVFSFLEGTLLAQTSGTFNFVGDTGKYVQSVYKNPSTGFLDFVTQINVTTGIIQDVTNYNFTDAGYSASYPDVGYNDAWSYFVGPFAAPIDVNASADGSVIEFEFGAAGVKAGQASWVLTVETNATNWTTGSIGLIDGGGETLNGFAPAAAEPTSADLLLMVLGTAGLILGKRAVTA